MVGQEGRGTMKTYDILSKCAEMDSDGLWSKCGTMLKRDNGTMITDLDINKLPPEWDGKLIISDRPAKDYKYGMIVLSHFEEAPF